MRRFTLFLGVIVLLFSCTSRKSDVYTINGKIQGLANGTAFLETRKGGMMIKVDSSAVTNSTFTFKGSVETPARYYVVFDKTHAYFPLFVENSDITISGRADSLRQLSITGSKAEDDYQAYLTAAKPYEKKLTRLYHVYDSLSQSGDEAALKQLEGPIDSTEKAQLEFLKQYIMDHRSSIVAPYLASINSYMFDLDVLEPMVNAFAPSLAGSDYVQELKERVTVLKRVAIGQPAPDFTMKDTTGIAVTLSSFKGKYVLVDFWASWCAPCRAENPNVVADFNEYKDKGFTVLGVSLDNDRNAWLNAIRKDKLTWTQVSDLKRWANTAAKLYGVNAIPSNVLINPDGIIIGRNLRGKDLKNKLNEIL